MKLKIFMLIEISQIQQNKTNPFFLIHRMYILNLWVCNGVLLLRLLLPACKVMTSPGSNQLILRWQTDQDSMGLKRAQVVASIKRTDSQVYFQLETSFNEGEQMLFIYSGGDYHISAWEYIIGWDQGSGDASLSWDGTLAAALYDLIRGEEVQHGYQALWPPLVGKGRAEVWLCG